MEPTADPKPETVATEDETSMGVLVSRSTFGGVLMGLANLVPGISGGTMLLAAGIYPRFIQSVSEVTRLKFRTRSLIVLGCVAGSAGIGILLLAGVLKDLVIDHRWIMYSLFIGLTLGGVPVVWKLARPASKSLVTSAILAFAVMVVLAILQATGVVGTGESNFVMLFIAGLAGASAMILPGVSGGYLLLLLGQYVPILAGVDAFKSALKERDFAAMMDPFWSVVVPVGTGVVLGVVAVGNLLQWLLKRYRKATLGALLGLLLGSTIGLWPFQAPVAPANGDTVKGRVVTDENRDNFDRDDWNTEFFRPSLGNVAGAIGLIGLGFGITQAIALVGRED